MVDFSAHQPIDRPVIRHLDRREAQESKDETAPRRRPDSGRSRSGSRLLRDGRAPLGFSTASEQCILAGCRQATDLAKDCLRCNRLIRPACGLPAPRQSVSRGFSAHTFVAFLKSAMGQTGDCPLAAESPTMDQPVANSRPTHADCQLLCRLTAGAALSLAIVALSAL